MSYARALQFSLGWEGGVSDHPHDRGGLTKWGITQAAYDAYRDRQAQPQRPVTAMTPEEMEAIYYEDYWIPAGCGLFRYPCDLCQFEAAIQHGQTMAVILMQRALGVNDDGKIGPQTRGAAFRVRSPALFAREMLLQRAYYYWAIFLNPTRGAQQLSSFGRGWRNRLMDLHRLVGSTMNRDLTVDFFEPAGVRNDALMRARGDLT